MKMAVTSFPCCHMPMLLKTRGACPGKYDEECTVSCTCILKKCIRTQSKDKVSLERFRLVVTTPSISKVLVCSAMIHGPGKNITKPSLDTEAGKTAFSGFTFSSFVE